MTGEKLLDVVNGKRVLFVTPSDVDYIRNKQEIRILTRAARALDIIAPIPSGSIEPTGIKRILRANLKVISAGVKKYDAIFIGGIPQLLIPLVGMLSGKKTIIVDFFISLYDTLVCDRRLLSEKNPLAWFLKKLDRYTLSRADFVVVDTREHGVYFSQMFQIDPDKIAVIYLEADSDIYYPRNVERPPELMDKFIVFFFGAMNPLQGVEVILDAARLLEEHDQIVFVIIGPIGKVNSTSRYSRLSNVRHAARWLPQTEVADYIAMADLCLAGHFNATVSKASRVIPGKAYSYLAMKKPVILGDNPANRELFPRESGNVHYVNMGDPVRLAGRILELAGSKQKEIYVNG